ncbi:hypothetical protein SAMN02910276_00027 [Butyrivibrio sp. Su6]|uniref:hypothetical protein n=1 Tax=Butyrivibrio sp. Su6 TaxID=1520810 RepID=UPI00089E9B3F|nr:hypothetical protein [Butyrivibrio sp. Su6]SEF39152.1 hypothetical protein SAMN02910276_00027 [Butyrivibrio sp. Su6]
MLKLLAPIEITAKTTIVNDNESFTHSIMAGYDLMKTRIEKTDLLHVVNTPPEVYIAEGNGFTSILNQNSSNQVNYEKIEIINNLMNSIVNSASVDLTYQMRTFVTDALYKLGIRDDRKFMKSFYEIVNEYKEKNKLIDMFFSDNTEVENIRNALTELINNRESQDNRRFEKTENLNLYESIFNRLQTGAIYQIVSNFAHTQETNQISAEEFLVSEQNNTALNMLINNIAQSAEFKSPEIIYNYENEYEQEYAEGNVTNEQNSSLVTSAVFLDMIRNLYNTGYDRFSSNSNTYYDFTSTIYNSSNNTFHRLYNETFVDRTSNRLVEEYENTNKAEIVNTYEDKSQMSSDEVLVSVLNEINIQNEERRKQYTQLINQIERKYKNKKKKLSFKETIKDAKLALNDKDRLIEKLEEREEESALLDDQMRKEIELIFPDEAGKIFETVANYYKNTTEAGVSQMTQQSISMLISNIEEVRHLNEASYQQNVEIKNEISEGAKIVHNIIENGPENTRTVETVRENVPKIEKVHRKSETISSEDIEETLNQYRRNITREIKNEVKQETESIQNTTTNKVINTINTTKQEIETPDIRRMVQEGVNASLGTISDKVYTKIERRLASEKSRRGY